MDGYSLAEILENFGSLNETLIHKITKDILNCFREYEDLYLEDYGEICPCNILFDKYGKLKVIK